MVSEQLVNSWDNQRQGIVSVKYTSKCSTVGLESSILQTFFVRLRINWILLNALDFTTEFTFFPQWQCLEAFSNHICDAIIENVFFQAERMPTIIGRPPPLPPSFLWYSLYVHILTFMVGGIETWLVCIYHNKMSPNGVREGKKSLKLDTNFASIVCSSRSCFFQSSRRFLNTVVYLKNILFGFRDSISELEKIGGSLDGTKSYRKLLAAIYSNGFLLSR